MRRLVLTDKPAQDKRRIRALAWVALGVSAVVATVELWSNTAQATAIYNVIFDQNLFSGLFFLGVIYLTALVLDVVAAAALKGWRNRVIALAGIIVLLLPVAWGIWVAESP
jgi:DMSO reductase anchor subunit